MELINYGEDNIYDNPDFPSKFYIKLGTKHRVWENGKPTDKYERVWRFDVISMLFDRWNGFFSPHGWDTHLFPSWGSGFITLWNNICTFLTPWYRMRRRLLSNLYNRNDSKLLCQNRKSCSFRTRGADQWYFNVRMGFVYGKMEAVHYVGEDGNGRNSFIDGITAALSGKPLPKVREDRVVIIKRLPILTNAQCEDFLHIAMIRTNDYLVWS